MGLTFVRALAEYPLVSPLLSTVKRYERPLSAISMVAGFAFDSYLFGHVDHAATHIVLLAYLIVAIGAILLVHFVEADAEPPDLLKSSQPLLRAATQFALGGLWSAFLVFYGRSALVENSWPFLAFLALMMIGNEAFRQYHSRLAFTCTLLFLALYSYAIFVVPMITGTMGRETFVLSGACAAGAFATVLFMLRVVGVERIKKAWGGIALGAAGVAASLNFFYFANILPPLPLTLMNAGVYHSVTKEGDVYRAVAAPDQGFSWSSLIGDPPVMRLTTGDSLSVYSAVFAPIELRTNVIHVWRRYDEAARMWRAESTVRFSIVGGREGGYRGYSRKSTPANGRWRVDIETPDGLLIGRVSFSVAPGSAAGRTLEILR